jgi:hypothetical protein
MAQIIVLTSEAGTVLQGILFREINRYDADPDYGKDCRESDLNTLHKMYSDVVNR